LREQSADAAGRDDDARRLETRDTTPTGRDHPNDRAIFDQ
jgi:hypothetical protein